MARSFRKVSVFYDQTKMFRETKKRSRIRGSRRRATMTMTLAEEEIEETLQPLPPVFGFQNEIGFFYALKVAHGNGRKGLRIRQAKDLRFQALSPYWTPKRIIEAIKK